MAKQELLATIRDRYRASSKREKSRILDESSRLPVITASMHQVAGAVRRRRRELPTVKGRAHLRRGRERSR